ncbi:hypothetical protein [Pseudomonas sp. O230]|uniref:hypothetical protein n=1 Tax=Pseudomonas sp. O230 TaxID=3159450 RepID=UPI00387AE9CA
MSWWIRVYVEPGEREDTLAVWESGAYRWAERLTETGILTQTKTGGYPNEYKGWAGDLLPLLQDLKQRHPGEQFSKYQKRIDRCRTEAELLVELWDQS